MFFDADDNLTESLEMVMEGGMTSYRLHPFALDGTGGVYVLLNEILVGYISTEGEAGIIAKSLEDFFTICFSLDMNWYNFCQEGTFDSFASFQTRLQWLKDNSIIDELEQDDALYLHKFIDKYHFSSNIENTYQLLKDGIMTQPEFVIRATSEDFEDSSDFFGTNHQYISSLLH